MWSADVAALSVDGWQPNKDAVVMQSQRLLIVMSKLDISSSPSNLLNTFLLVPQIWLLLTIVCVYKLYLTFAF